MKSARLNKMEEYIRDRQTVSLKELQDTFDLSINTVRRYITVLLDRNPEFQKVYGGICVNAPKESSPSAPEDGRTISCVAEKQRSCQYAATLIQPHDIVYIDNGTSTSYIPMYLPDAMPLTIITNSVRIINGVIDKPGITLVVLPGILNRTTLSFTGENCSRQLETYNIQKAFMSCVGFSLNAGATNFSIEEYKIKSTAAQRADQIILLADHTKIGHNTLMTYCPTSRIDLLVTDKDPGPEYTEAFLQYNHAIAVV